MGRRHELTPIERKWGDQREVWHTITRAQDGVIPPWPEESGRHRKQKGSEKE